MLKYACYFIFCITSLSAILHLLSIYMLFFHSRLKAENAYVNCYYVLPTQNKAYLIVSYIYGHCGTKLRDPKEMFAVQILLKF